MNFALGKISAVAGSAEWKFPCRLVFEGEKEYNRWSSFGEGVSFL